MDSGGLEYLIRNTRTVILAAGGFMETAKKKLKKLDNKPSQGGMPARQRSDSRWSSVKGSNEQLKR